MLFRSIGEKLNERLYNARQDAMPGPMLGGGDPDTVRQVADAIMKLKGAQFGVGNEGVDFPELANLPRPKMDVPQGTAEERAALLRDLRELDQARR